MNSIYILCIAFKIELYISHNPHKIAVNSRIKTQKKGSHFDIKIAANSRIQIRKRGSHFDIKIAANSRIKIRKEVAILVSK